MAQNKIKLTLLFGIFISLLSCNEHEDQTVNHADLVRTGGVIIDTDGDQPENIMEGIQVSEESGMAYGIDYRRQLPYKLSLKDGTFNFLSESGRGPEELSLPNQLFLDKENELRIFVYDGAQDKVAFFESDEITEKTEGFLEENIWNRGTYGMYWNGHLISSMKEPERINALDFDNARPIVLMSIDDQSFKRVGEFSPTLDNMDSSQKYPYVALNQDEGHIYYVFRTDYTILRYNLKDGSNSVAADYRPEEMRKRTIPFDHDNAYHFTAQFSREFNLDLTRVAGIEIIGDQLVVVWRNANQSYYDNPVYTAENYDNFGVVYNLPDLTNPREFSLPGKLLGSWGDRLLVEENEDVMEYTIGFYEFDN